MRSGRYSPQGPDYEGQIRRLRTGDGVYFTKFGARKLAHYVEREVQRIVGNKGLPVALPIPVDPAPQAPKAKPSVPAERPEAGPVVPLTVTRVAPEELLGGGRRFRSRHRHNRHPHDHQGRAGRGARAGGPTISAGRVARSISSRGRSSRRRLTPRCRMPARNPPSLPSAGRRWMPTPLKRADRSRPSVGRAHAPIPIPRFSDSSGRGLAAAASRNS